MRGLICRDGLSPEDLGRGIREIFELPPDETANPAGHSNAATSADNLSKAGWSWGSVSAVDCEGRTIWIADAHRDDGRRFIVTADQKLSAFVELEGQVLTVTFYLESIQ